MVSSMEEEKEFHSFFRSQNREAKKWTFHGRSAECPYIEKEEEEEEEEEFHSFVHSQKRRLKFLKKTRNFFTPH